MPLAIRRHILICFNHDLIPNIGSYLDSWCFFYTTYWVGFWWGAWKASGWLGPREQEVLFSTPHPVHLST